MLGPVCPSGTDPVQGGAARTLVKIEPGEAWKSTYIQPSGQGPTRADESLSRLFPTRQT